MFEAEPLRAPVERIVSEYLQRPWQVKRCRDMTELACHPAAILSDGDYEVFAKYSAAANGMKQFGVELAGLRLLAELAGVKTPVVIGLFPVAAGSILVLEAVRGVNRTPRRWRQIGQALARIHRLTGDRFGLETNGYFGPLPQDNTPMVGWAEFYAQRRLEPGLRLATASGNLPVEVARQVEKLISRLPELCGPQPVPTLLHGDAQQNNWISTAAGPVVIDPAVYFGHPEMDLAFIDIWQGVPGEVLQAYQDELPVDPGFWERRDLWRIWGYLAAVTVEGPAYLARLIAAVEKYL